MRQTIIYFISFIIISYLNIFPQNNSSKDYVKEGSNIICKDARFQFLTPTLVRMEYSSTQSFIDEPTVVVLKRKWENVNVKAGEKNGWIEASSDNITLKYNAGSGKFTKDNLIIAWQDSEGKHTWSPGDSDKNNLGGIYYSLDGISSNKLPPFTPGLLSRSGYFILDDSHSPVWDNNISWIKPRKGPSGQDIYFFEYGKDYKHVLKEYSELCGRIPMIPRYVFGSWITDLNYEYLSNSDLVKDYSYTDDNLKNEIMRFKQLGIPLDVLVLDFAWHKFGWAGGYDWSPIFPHPEQFLEWAHNEGIKISVNDHPGYGHENVLSDKDSHAAEIRRNLDLKPYVPPKFVMDIKNDWKFKLDPDNIGESEKWYSLNFNDNNWKTIQAGDEWEDQGYPDYDGYAWYRKPISIPKNANADSLYLIFGGVDDEYDLFINGEKIAHFGIKPDYSVYNSTTYTNISSFAKTGKNILISLRVNDWGGGGGITKLPVEIADAIAPQGIRFNLADKHQADISMKVLHDPIIKEGVNFWWIDGGSGSCEMPGLNSQLWTNRVFYDFTQELTKERGFVFSRYGGWGNHRYPGFFTGDTHSEWGVLNYEVAFTARGGNTLTPYITHDIGGFLGKKIPSDLYARWVEFGAFSPVIRLHSAFENPRDGNLRMPWTYGQKGIDVVRKFFRLRYTLLPYIYTYSRITYDDALPLVRPLYLEYPTLDEAYEHPEEYFFGTQILVSPVTDDSKEKDIYLPPGEWYDYFTNEKYEGGKVISKKCSIDEIPLFVKAGAVIPTGPVREYSDEKPLDTLIINIFGTKGGRFDLYEDDGISMNYKQGEYSWTPITAKTNAIGMTEITVGPTKGEYIGQVSNRAYEIALHAFHMPKSISENGKQLSSDLWLWDDNNSILKIFLPASSIREELKIDIE